MRTFTLALAATLLLPMALSGQVTEKRSLAAFDEIRIGGSFDVEIVQGDVASAVITASEVKDIAAILTEVDGNTLRIRTRDDWRDWSNWKHNQKIRIRVTVPSLNQISLSGSGNVYSDAAWTAQRMEVNLSGSGNIKLTLKAQTAEVSITGSGDISLRGTSNNLDASVSGSGNIHALELVAQNVNVRIAGSGSAEVNAENELHTRNAGSGDVRYAGDPRTVELSNAGSGSVRRVR